MMAALWNGISGMNSYQDALTAESNNVANINTVGYKADNVSFADLAYTNGVGKGTQAGIVTKDHSQGNFKLTGGDYDLAINGKGFFTVYDAKKDETLYSRSGNFRIGNDGVLQTSTGLKVRGLSVGTTPDVTSTHATVNTMSYPFTETIGSQVVETSTEIKAFNSKSSNYINTAITDGISGTTYKTSGAKVSDAIALTTAYNTSLSSYASNVVAGTTPVAEIDTVAFTSFATDLTSSGNSVQITIDGSIYKQEFDTDAQTTMNKFADKISKIQGMDGSVDAVGNLTITSLIPGQELEVADAKINSTVFNVVTATASVAGTGLANVEATRTALSTAIQRAGGDFISMVNTLDLSTEADMNFVDLQMKLDTLNMSDNQFGDPEIDNGVIYLKQGENKFLVGKVTIAAFTNEIDLNPVGDNAYEAMGSAGNATSMAGITSVLDGTLELSNTQLSEGLVNLMVYQRAFEANSKLFAAADEFLNIAIQLKK
jgi:flagellar hook protein FlgE